MRALLAAALLFSLLLAPTAMAAWGMPDPLTERGQTVHDIYVPIAIVGSVVFLLVFAILVVILVRFREGSGHGKSTHEAHRGSIAAEMTWTIVPLGIMLWIGVMSYFGLVALDNEFTEEDAQMSVGITGVQWAWIMDYPDGVQVFVSPSADPETGVVSFSDTFHLPADTPVLMNLTGGDVIHAFNIRDANGAYVTMDDANPLGPHKYHRQVFSFPAGKYTIQCKEMCFNPGHAYMRAELVVEPKADYDRWFEERKLAVGAELIARVDATADADSVDTQSSLTVGAGTRVLMEVENKHDQAVTFTLPEGTATVDAKTQRMFAFDLEEPGDFTLTASNGGNLTFTVIDATPLAVTLDDFSIAPGTLQMQAGTTYLIQVQNVGAALHNLYIGSFEPRNVLGNSPNVAGGGTTSFLYTPSEAGTYDMWCDVSGHHGLGMSGTVVVS